MKEKYGWLNWTFGILLLFSVFGQVLIGSVIMATALTIASLLLLPPIRNFFHSKTNMEIPTKVRISLRLVLVFAGTFFDIQYSSKQEAEKQLVQQQEARIEAAKKSAAEQQKNVEYFNQNSAKVLAEVESAIKAKDFKKAVALASKYAPSKNQQLIDFNTTANAELARIDRQEKTKVILAQMKAVPVTEFANRLQMSQRLAALNPDNAEYAKMVVLYSGKAKELETKVQLVREKNRKDEETWRAKYGAPPSQANSGWCPAVVNYLKEQLNDPDSLAMGDCTKAELTSGGWNLHCSYRAKNGFGALVKESRSFWVHRERVIYVQGD